jgi:hypothetical protein
MTIPPYFPEAGHKISIEISTEAQKKENKNKAKVYKTACKKTKTHSSTKNIFKEMVSRKLQSKMGISYKNIGEKENQKASSIRNNTLPAELPLKQEKKLCLEFSNLNFHSKN